MRNALFFIALIPPGQIADEIMDFKHYSAKKFNSRKALNSPAHITLFPPFRFNEKNLHELFIPLYELAEKTSSFYLTLNGFDHFSNKVVFVKAEHCKNIYELQDELVQKLKALMPGNTVSSKFHPHATVAFRDLDRENFEKAWEYYKTVDYLRVFEANSFFLLKHDGKVWRAINQFKFK